MRRSRIVPGSAKPADPSRAAIFAWAARSFAVGRGIDTSSSPAWHTRHPGESLQYHTATIHGHHHQGGEMGTLGERGDGGASRAALMGFRAAFFACLSGWADALFELTDAALCGPASVNSVPSLSLEPVFRRSHGSLYKALAAGRIDAEALRGALVTHRPAGWPMVFAVDASTWDRCDAETSPERGFYYSASQRSQVDASTANTGGQSAGRCARRAERSRSLSIRPRASALYRLPWLRRKTGSRLNDGTEPTGAGAQSAASQSSNSASAQAVNEP